MGFLRRILNPLSIVEGVPLRPVLSIEHEPRPSTASLPSPPTFPRRSLYPFAHRRVLAPLSSARPCAHIIKGLIDCSIHLANFLPMPIINRVQSPFHQ